MNKASYYGTSSYGSSSLRILRGESLALLAVRETSPRVAAIEACTLSLITTAQESVGRGSVAAVC